MRRALFWLTLLALPLAVGCSKKPDASSEAGQRPTPAKKGLSAAGALQVDPADRCPVCGMAPHKSPKFASGLSAKDGTTWYTCGTGCMLRAHLHPEVYLGVPADQLDQRVTPEYFGGKPVDATTVHWVTGSDVKGPMGPAPVALANDADLATFKQRHGGKHTFKLAELTDARFREVTGKPALLKKKMKGKKGHGHSHGHDHEHGHAH